MSEWQPISTAPKNEMILGFFPDADTEIMIVGCLVTDHPDDSPDWYHQDDRLGAPLDVEPTHWMPLPEPPL